MKLPTRITLAALCAAVAAGGALAASAAAAPARSCRVPAGGAVLVRTSSAVVYRVAVTAEAFEGDTSAVIGCLGSQGIPRRLSVEGFDGLDFREARLVRSAGRYVALVTSSVDRLLTRRDHVRVVDLRRGRAVEALAHDGDTTEPLGALRVSSSGRVAWTLAETRTPEQLPTGVWTIARGAPHHVDGSPDVQSGSLRLDGCRLRWRRGAATLTRRLAPALP